MDSGRCVYVKTLKVSKTFRVCKAETSALTESIVRVEREIDRLVYRLYDLTPEEIAIVEESKQPESGCTTSTCSNDRNQASAFAGGRTSSR